MTGWLVDTNVISELRRPKPDRNVLRFLRETAPASLHVSIVTLAEIRYGAELLEDPQQRALVEGWLEGTVRPIFAGRVLVVDEAVFLIWKSVFAAARRTGGKQSTPDLLIGATATAHGLTVLSRDVRPFLQAGVPVLDPWTGTLHREAPVRED